MRTVLLSEGTGLAVVERPVPEARPDWSVIQVLACGLCGTDRHIVHRDYPSALPIVLGHEFGGVVAQAGDGSAFAVGDVVSVDPNISCGTCPECAAGRRALCPERIALGVDIDGGLSEFALVPDTQLHRVPATVPAVHLAFVEPLACCLRGLDLAALQGGETVAVVGAGVMGQLMVQLAADAGASEITVVSRQPEKRALALGLGATRELDPSDEAACAAAPRHDVVFECAGVTETFTLSQRLARRGGSVIVLGIPPQGEQVAISPFDLVVDELRIQGSFLNPLTQGRAADLIGAGRLDLDPLVSRVVGLDDVGSVLQGSAGRTDIKVVVTPGA